MVQFLEAFPPDHCVARKRNAVKAVKVLGMAKNRFTKTLLLSSLLIVIAGNFSYAADDSDDSAADSSQVLHDVVLAKDASVPSVAQLVSLYQDRDFRPIWTGDGEGARMA